MRRVWWRREDGTVLILAIGSTLLVLATVLALADASSLRMRRTLLAMVADDAAMAAARAGGDPERAEAQARLAVAADADTRLTDVRVDAVAVGPDGVHVVLSAALPPPIGAVLVPAGVRLRAAADARPPVAAP